MKNTKKSIEQHFINLFGSEEGPLMLKRLDYCLKLKHDNPKMSKREIAKRAVNEFK